ncbi:hypothetical protein [Pseudochryseolinea flava]|uniref:CHRD domain-containing protein n=1 Tax=Pseudochryseolinea flava TaxID=2059302 RepID=A0A364XVK7_9BACT|nr:hypothetical protein [Pseudochryseolinea flava]RAV98385.1 hypothetical protein DQQ10_23955 [Pseudochryseolinea flava]
MKYLMIIGLISLALVACQENESVKKNDFTGNEATYALKPGSEYAVQGAVTFQEKVDGTILVTLQLTGTEGKLQHPVHLHLGNIGTPDADVAAQLMPVEGSNGKSETILSQLADESKITYNDIIGLDACIKVHLAASGPDKDIVLAGGNIGKAFANDGAAGRLGFSTCRSN